MKFVQRKRQGEICPRGYGLCWFDSSRREAVVAPLGVNLLMAFSRFLHSWVAFEMSRAMDRAVRKWRSERDAKV